MSCVFASDLHLSAGSPEKVDLFDAFMRRSAQTAQALYLLGDVFEIWLGDDDQSAPNPGVIRAMRQFSNSGARLFVMCGNRDFLIGANFIKETGATLLPDWQIIDLAATPTLLTHGDLLCTKDVEYQAFRQYVRDPKNQADFLALPLPERRQVAAKMRSGTQASMLEKDDFIMDVEQSTVERVMAEHGVAQLIHGHTHRPATHQFKSEGVQRERIVLGDWYGDACSIIVSTDGGLTRMSAAEFVTNASA